jgi:hypothetical protein
LELSKPSSILDVNFDNELIFRKPTVGAANDLPRRSAPYAVWVKRGGQPAKKGREAGSRRRLPRSMDGVFAAAVI